MFGKDKAKAKTKAAKDSAKERDQAAGKSEQSAKDVEATQQNQEKMVELKETGLPGPGERTEDGGTSGNPHAVPEGTSAAQYQRGANITDKGLQDVPGSRPLALKQVIDGFERQMKQLIPSWAQNESKLVMDKIEELRGLAETGAAKQKPDGYVEPTA